MYRLKTKMCERRRWRPHPQWVSERKNGCDNKERVRGVHFCCGRQLCPFQRPGSHIINYLFLYLIFIFVVIYTAQMRYSLKRRGRGGTVSTTAGGHAPRGRRLRRGGKEATPQLGRTARRASRTNIPSQLPIAPEKSNRRAHWDMPIRIYICVARRPRPSWEGPPDGRHKQRSSRNYPPRPKSRAEELAGIWLSIFTYAWAGGHAQFGNDCRQGITNLQLPQLRAAPEKSSRDTRDGREIKVSSCDHSERGS